MDIQSRSRSPNGVSVLKIEYYNHPTPNIIGQWVDELDAGFELSRNEEVHLLTIWLTPMSFSPATPRLKVGQVAAIHVETTLSRSVTFRSPGFYSLPSRTLQNQYRSSSGEKLTALSWLLNVDSDIIRAVISPNGSRKGQILVPEMDPPFDLVQKVYFETQNSNGDVETITAAKAYLRDQATVGLEFVYTSSSRAKIGDFDTDTHQTVHFAPNTRIVGFSTTTTEVEEEELRQIELRLNEMISLNKTDLKSP
ncbi:hypothetical protein PISL3812_04716 [Talaromyces islandicus]|uniref:Uncharacterized protein n=1 Tax=Talaromyces islandicus TaxID=28573 RepID=A0A0U1LXY5_TALIS|nr:hypothetical protein PISL3812_04716 [Talaromyces islandicus]